MIGVTIPPSIMKKSLGRFFESGLSAAHRELYLLFINYTKAVVDDSDTWCLNLRVATTRLVTYDYGEWSDTRLLAL